MQFRSDFHFVDCKNKKTHEIEGKRWTIHIRIWGRSWNIEFAVRGKTPGCRENAGTQDQDQTQTQTQAQAQAQTDANVTTLPK